jgi:hypothetical protein
MKITKKIKDVATKSNISLMAQEFSALLEGHAKTQEKQIEDKLDTVINQGNKTPTLSERLTDKYQQILARLIPNQCLDISEEYEFEKENADNMQVDQEEYNKNRTDYNSLTGVLTNPTCP